MISTMIVAAALTALPLAGAHAMPVAADFGGPAAVSRVAGGCGPGAWRGPWGHCRNTPYSGPLPGGWYPAGIRSAPGTGALRATGAARGDIAAIRPSMAGCLEAATDRRSEHRYAERRWVGWGCGARARRIRLSEGAMRARTVID